MFLNGLTRQGQIPLATCKNFTHVEAEFRKGPDLSSLDPFKCYLYFFPFLPLLL